MNKGIRTARDSAVRLSACVQASGAQTKPRSAHVNVRYEDHGAPNIDLTAVASIVTKARSRRRDEMRLQGASLQTRPFAA